VFSHDANAASRSREWALYITTSENNTEAEERYSKEAEREAGSERHWLAYRKFVPRTCWDYSAPGACAFPRSPASARSSTK